MAETKSKPGTAKRTFRLFLIIFVALLVPLVMDQAEVDRETVRQAGRIAAGVTLLLSLYGLFTKALRALAFVVLALLGVMVLVSEGVIDAPRLFSDRPDSRAR